MLQCHTLFTGFTTPFSEARFVTFNDTHGWKTRPQRRQKKKKGQGSITQTLAPRLLTNLTCNYSQHSYARQCCLGSNEEGLCFFLHESIFHACWSHSRFAQHFSNVLRYAYQTNVLGDTKQREKKDANILDCRILASGGHNSLII